MPGNLLIKNGHILDPGLNIDITGDLLVVKGKTNNPCFKVWLVFLNMEILRDNL